MDDKNKPPVDIDDIKDNTETEETDNICDEENS